MPMDKVNPNRDRICYIDFIKSIAVVTVIIQHVATCVSWGGSFISSDWNAFNTFVSLSKIGVPLFVMSSGTLFLQRNISIRDIYKKYIFRLVVAYLFWGIVYALLYYFTGELKGLPEIIFQVFLGPYHFWFIPMIIGIYMIYPILLKIVADEIISKYFLLLAFVFGCVIPSILNCQYLTQNGKSLFSLINDIYNNMHIKFVLGFSFYFVLGHLLDKNKFNRYKRVRIAEIILFVFGCIITILFTHFLVNYLDEYSEAFLSVFSFGICIMSVSAFDLMKTVYQKNHFISSKLKPIWLLFSKNSFGIYLTHVLFLVAFSDNVKSFGLSNWIVIPVYSIFVLILSFFTSVLLHYIPYVKKWIV